MPDRKELDYYPRVSVDEITAAAREALGLSGCGPERPGAEAAGVTPDEVPVEPVMSAEDALRDHQP